jgi:hypothetical protein
MMVEVSEQDWNVIIAALTFAVEQGPKPMAFRPTMERVYEWAGEQAPRDYERDDYVEICVDDGSWIPAQVTSVGPEYVGVEYQHSARNGPFHTNLTRASIRHRRKVRRG